MIDGAPDASRKEHAIRVAAKLKSNIVSSKVDVQDLAGGTGSPHMPTVKKKDNDLSDSTFFLKPLYDEQRMSLVLFPYMVQPDAQGQPRTITFHVKRGIPDDAKRIAITTAIWEGVTDEEKSALILEQMEMFEERMRQSTEYYSNVDKHKSELSSDIQAGTYFFRARVDEILEGEEEVEGITNEEASLLRADNEKVDQFIAEKARTYGEKRIEEKRNDANRNLVNLLALKSAAEKRSLIMNISDADAALEVSMSK